MYYLLSSVLFYDYTNTLFFARLAVSISLGESSSGSIYQKDSSRKRKRIQINGGGKSC